MDVNDLKRHITPTLTQGALLGLMLLTAPYAMSFLPYERIYTDSVWGVDWHQDPMFHLRAGLIIGGLTGAFLSVVLLIWGLNKINHIDRDLRWSCLILQVSMTICSLAIGWAAFPYWVNGMFQAYSGNPRVLEHNPIFDFDPKALMPQIWIGETWRLIVFLILLFALCIVPLLFLLMAFFSIRNKNKTWKQDIVSIACWAITAAVFFLSPDYLRWLVD